MAKAGFITRSRIEIIMKKSAKKKLGKRMFRGGIVLLASLVIFSIFIFLYSCSTCLPSSFTSDYIMYFLIPLVITGFVLIAGGYQFVNS